MSDTVWILSTESCSSIFRKFGTGAPGAPLPVLASVCIHGGSNIGSIKKAYGDQSMTEDGIPFYTPRGVVTPIPRAAYVEILKDNETFQTGVNGGFYKVLDKDPGENHAEVKKIVAAEMKAEDNSAPLTAARLKTAGKLKVRTTLNTGE